MEWWLTVDAVVSSILASGIVEPRILPLAGLRRIVCRPDRARHGNPGTGRSWPRRAAARSGVGSIAGYG